MKVSILEEMKPYAQKYGYIISIDNKNQWRIRFVQTESFRPTACFDGNDIEQVIQKGYDFITSIETE